MNWRRLLTSLLVVVFATISTMAGASVKHCSAPGGHAALEFVIPGYHGHAHAGHESHASIEDTRVDSVIVTEACQRVLCVDDALLSASNQISSVELTKPAILPVVLPGHREPSYGPPRVVIRPAYDVALRGSQHHHLRTIVLLI